MRIEDINQLWDRFDKSVATEMELEMEGVKFSLKKGGCVAQSGVMVTQVTGSEAVSDEADNSVDTASEEETEEDLIYVKAPLVGTFYRAASPDAEPFVTIGQKVCKGDVVGIIEAMKLMNEITAPEDGTVAVIKATDSSMVEYDQILLGIKKL